MELDWCSDEKVLENTSKFNEISIIDKDKRKKKIEENQDENEKKDIEINNCFSINLEEIKDSKDLLLILNYLSLISNHLRTFMRNKSNKYNEINKSNKITEKEYELIVNYLKWLNIACISIKKYFAVPLRKDNSYDPNNVKLFKTSSYKFCNFKESCLIHKNKQNKCDKNHFVFDMIINDIQKLIESIETLEQENINWILDNKIIKMTYNLDVEKYNIEKLPLLNEYINNDNEFVFVIDKTLILKSFDVISYVLNKMYDESNYFLNNDYETFLINLDFSN
jgi:hypothetical protein